MGDSFPSDDGRPSPMRVMDAERRPAQAPSEPLRVAAGRIAERWEDLATGWMASREEASAVLIGVVREVERLCSGGRRPGSGGPPQRPLLHHRLSEALRVELLREWRAAPEGSEGYDSETILELISALEEYRACLWPGGKEDAATRLAEPDAFELVVEMAHDLRSPLNSTLFLSEVLRSGQSGPVSDHQRRQLGLIYSATLGMISVVSDVMDLAGDNKGLLDEDPTAFSIGAVFDSVREMVFPMAEEKGIELEFRVPEYDQCIGHPGPLGRVLLNLTTNALKFTDAGGVTVSAEKLGRSLVELSVRDTGRGIRPEELERLFHPFRKSENRKGYFFSGSGLGLSISRRLVTAMGSELKVKTRRGQGTRFFFRVELPPASSL
jgi:signal transduction histidine kinase